MEFSIESSTNLALSEPKLFPQSILKDDDFEMSVSLDDYAEFYNLDSEHVWQLIRNGQILCRLIQGKLMILSVKPDVHVRNPENVFTLEDIERSESQELVKMTKSIYEHIHGLHDTMLKDKEELLDLKNHMLEAQSTEIKNLEEKLAKSQSEKEDLEVLINTLSKQDLA